MMLLLLAAGAALQPDQPVRLPVDAYGGDESVWSVTVDQNGVLYRQPGDTGDRIMRYFRPARVERRGARTVFTSRTAAGQPVVLTIEPGACGTAADNQTALRAQLEIEGRTLTGCAEDGGTEEPGRAQSVIGDYVLDEGIRAFGRNGEWHFSVGGFGGNYLERGEDRISGEGALLQPRIARGAATYSFIGADRRRVSATVRVAPCRTADGHRLPFTVEVRAAGATLRGCGSQGNMPPMMMTMSDGGSGPELLSGGIDNDMDYPESALRAEVSGPVTVRYVVGANGRVTSCTVEESSGDSALDSTTCSLLQRRFRFEPARDRYGQPREAVRSFRMVWRLPPQ